MSENKRRPKPIFAVQKADLRRYLEQVYPSPELEQWFDPLIVRVNRECREIHIAFPHVFFAGRFRDKVRMGFENHCLPLLQGWSLRWSEPERVPAPARRASRSEKPRTGDLPLERHTFSSFLHNRKNDFPLAAAKACAGNIGNPPYVPLVIYGQSGAGKTHLLGAIANEAREHAPDYRFFCGPAASLPAGEHFEAVFLDDLQRARKADLQERLVILLDMMAATGGAFVCTIDAPPAASGLASGLAQRLGAGLVVELKKPDLDVRRRYAAGLCETYGLDAGKDAALSLAQRCMDFRAIDGAVNRARAYATLVPGREAEPVDILNAGPDQRVLTPEQIILTTARFFSLTPEHLTGKSRDKTTAEARRHAVTLCRELLGLSLPQLGRIFGGRDHSSIVYTIKKFKEIQSGNKDMHNTHARLKQMCLTPSP